MMTKVDSEVPNCDLGIVVRNVDGHLLATTGRVGGG